MISKPILTSGIRPTGDVHIGNYIGAMRDIINLQETTDAHFFIVDIHSLTTHSDETSLAKRTIDAAKLYVAAGLDPHKATFYTQSVIAAEITELATYLGMVMPLGELLRCPTFKEKAKKHPDHVHYGLAGYPVLMAADILIHKGELVPVGEDQLVHLEMARAIVRRFSAHYGPLFPEPKPVENQSARVPSLTGEGIMSKSDGKGTTISLKDPKEVIEQKVKRAYSDPLRTHKVKPGHPTRTGCNVFHLHEYFSEPEEQQSIQTGCQTAEIGCVACKQMLATSIERTVVPIRQTYEQLTDADIHDLLLMGKEKAKVSAQQTIQEVREAIGFYMY